MSKSARGKRFGLDDLRKAARAGGAPLAMLTCYDYLTARVLEEAGIRMLLVGDSAANVILGHDSTIPVPLSFMIELTAAVRRGAPQSLVLADMPFGTCATVSQGVKNCLRMVKLTGCDGVKIECSRGHIELVQALADSGVAVVAHLGLTPQSVGLLGGYKVQGRTASDAMKVFDLAGDLMNAGAAALLLEATPPEVARLITQTLDVPVIGCGAGPDCHAHVVVLSDLVGMTESSPKFAPRLGDLPSVIASSARRYAADIASGKYPGKAHHYDMPADERQVLRDEAKGYGLDI
jgi:3-methyl-2-oxobutanoate hydroxymethyltransferase